MQNDWSLATFKEKFAKGEIHDFKPWMENGPKGIRYVMAKNGIEVEELLKDDDYGIINRLIEHGYAKEHWESWKDHPYGAVRLSLALKGLWPEHYLNDPDEHVRSCVIISHPEYALQGLERSSAEWDAAEDVIRHDPNVPLETVETFIRTQDHRVYARDAYRMKAKALKIKSINTLERTMSVKALYYAGNPLWARSLSIQAIDNILDAEKELREIDRMDIMDEYFDDFVQAYGSIEVEHIIRYAKNKETTRK